MPKSWSNNANKKQTQIRNNEENVWANNEKKEKNVKLDGAVGGKDESRDEEEDVCCRGKDNLLSEDAIWVWLDD